MSFPGGSDGKESACNVGVKVKVAQSCPTLCDPMDCYSPWNSPGQNTRVGSLSLLQGIFPTQGLNPGLPHCRRFLYQLSHKGNNVGDLDSIPGLGRSHGGGHGNSLQYSCLENPHRQGSLVGYSPLGCKK